jgi:hypothetical protein
MPGTGPGMTGVSTRTGCAIAAGLLLLRGGDARSVGNELRAALSNQNQPSFLDSAPTSSAV